MTNKIEIECNYCHKIFHDYKYRLRAKTHFCSFSCKSASTKKVVICKCGKEFTVSKLSNRKFCSTKCGHKYQTKRTGKKITCTCLNCNKTFEWYAFQDRKFCSHQCVNEYYKLGYKKGTEHINYKNGLFMNGKTCVDCGVQISRNKGVRCIKCNGIFYRGINSPHFGRMYRASRTFYNNRWFRSSWEANFAKWCDFSGITWEYESKTFSLIIKNKATTYTPDFYLSDFDCYIEIKGRWIRDSYKKFNLFKQTYNNIELFERNRLKEIGVL